MRKIINNFREQYLNQPRYSQRSKYNNKIIFFVEFYYLSYLENRLSPIDKRELCPDLILLSGNIFIL